jgi:hypothetical protein
MTTQAPLRDQLVSEVIASAPNAEDVLEACGVDYWFGGDQTLGAACAAAGVDVATVEAQILPHLHEAEGKDDSLPALLAELTSHLDAEVRPAIARVRDAARNVPESRLGPFLAMVDGVDAMVAGHATLVSNCVLPAIAAGQSAGVSDRPRLDHAVVRELAEQHALLAVRIRKVLDQCAVMDSDGTPQTAALTAAVRTLARAIHHHVRISYGSIMPHLFEDAPIRRRQPERF